MLGLYNAPAYLSRKTLYQENLLVHFLDILHHLHLTTSAFGKSAPQHLQNPLMIFPLVFKS
jgi:hypothetical protein